MRREFERKGRVSTLVFAEQNSVDPDGRRDHGSFEVDEYALASRSGRSSKRAAVRGEELVARVIEVVPGHARVGVGKDDALEVAVIKGRSMRSFDLVGCVAPAAVDGQDQAAMRYRFGGVAGGVGHGDGCKSRAGGFEKAASIHSLLAPRVLLCGLARWSTPATVLLHAETVGGRFSAASCLLLLSLSFVIRSEVIFSGLDSEDWRVATHR